MVRVAVIADIHANPFALEAVIEDIAQQNVDEVIVAGDLVGRGPLGSAVVTRIKALGWRCIRGNHEDYLLGFIRGEVPDAWLVTKEWAASRWMAAEVEEHREFMESLPLQTTSSLRGGLRIVHGSTTSYNEGLGPWTSEEKLREHLDAVEEDVLVCAHIHRPMERAIGNRAVINVGSVGLPFNGDWRAQYGIFTDREGAPSWSVEFRQVPYDREAFLQAYETSGFLAAGDITAHLLREEVRLSRSHLVPFLKWASVTNREPSMEHLEAFDAFFDPSERLHVLLERLQNAEPSH